MKITKPIRQLKNDIKETINFFKVRRVMKKHLGMLVLTQVIKFDNPEMYISTDEVVALIKKYKLDPLSLSNTNNGGKGSACIAFSPDTQKWYGWSHRAVYGFKIGDVVSEGDLVTSTGYTEEFEIENPAEAFKYALPVGFTAKTLDDAKRMAIAYASSIS